MRRRFVLDSPTSGFWPATTISTLLVLGSLTAASATGFYLHFQRRAEVMKLLDRLSDELPDRIARVEAEIAQLGEGHRWAGCYRSPYANIVLWLAPEAGCVARDLGCVALSRANWGKVRELDGKLFVSFDSQNEDVDIRPFPAVYEIEVAGEARRLQGQHEQRDFWNLVEYRDR